MEAETTLGFSLNKKQNKKKNQHTSKMPLYCLRQ